MTFYVRIVISVEISVEKIPTSVRICKAAIELEDPKDAKIFLNLVRILAASICAIRPGDITVLLPTVLYYHKFSCFSSMKPGSQYDSMSIMSSVFNC